LPHPPSSSLEINLSCLSSGGRHFFFLNGHVRLTLFWPRRGQAFSHDCHEVLYANDSSRAGTSPWFPESFILVTGVLLSGNNKRRSFLSRKKSLLTGSSPRQCDAPENPNPNVNSHIIIKLPPFPI